MKRIFPIALALSLLSGTAALAQPNVQGRDQQQNNQARGKQAPNNQGGQDRYEAYRNDPNVRMSTPRLSKGDQVPDQYRNNQQYVVNDWQQRNLRKPPRGYHWVRDDNNNYFLAAVSTGLILDLLLNNH